MSRNKKFTLESLQTHKNAAHLLSGTGLVGQAVKLATVTPPTPPAVAATLRQDELVFKKHSFTVPGLPVPKPRMTQRDKWQKRPCVLRYRDYCDRCRAAAGKLPGYPDGFSFTAFLPMPAGWSAKKKSRMDGKPHRVKRGDLDNILKSLGDALYEEDSMIWYGGPLMKRWCFAGQERTEVTVLYSDERIHE